MQGAGGTWSCLLLFCSRMPSAVEQKHISAQATAAQATAMLLRQGEAVRSWSRVVRASKTSSGDDKEFGMSTKGQPAQGCVCYSRQPCVASHL